MRLRFSALVAVTTVCLLLVGGCAGKQITIPSTPLALDQVEQTVEGAAGKTLGILEAAGYVVVAAQDIELRLACLQASGGQQIDIPGCAVVIPRAAHDQIDGAFRSLAQRARGAIADIESGVIQDWPALRARVEPVLRDVEALARLVETLVGQARGGSLPDLLGTLSQIVSSALALIPRDQLEGA